MYLDNVDVNGVLLRPMGSSPWLLLVLINSRLLDWVFRRGSVPFQNEYWSANRQFIAGLPVATAADEARRLDELGRRLRGLAASIASERGDFAAWLRATLDASPAGALPGQRVLERYERTTGAELVATLASGRARLGVDPRERSTRELVEREHRASVERLLPLLDDLAHTEAKADDAVYELYGLPARMRRLVDSEYDAAPLAP